MLEIDVARCVIEHFSQSHEIYQEVKASSKRIIDIVMKSEDGIITTIETKLSLNLHVIEQSYINKDFSNISIIAVPEKSWTKSKVSMMKTILSSLNIGLIVVDYSGRIKTINTSEPRIPKKTLKLYDEQKFYSVAGSSGSKIFTPFKKTIENIREYLKQHGESTVHSVVSSISHHYKNERSAISSIRKYTKRRVFDDIRIIEESDVLYIEHPK